VCNLTKRYLRRRKAFELYFIIIRGDLHMKIDNNKDMRFLLSIILNAVLLAGLTFIYQINNLPLTIIYTIVMVINAIYLLVKTRNSWEYKDNI
ncbi:hypothetical protein, partial [Staphylococcus xylosus]|uniref:hypothetical protein n=1 Tax=Staphylococcus xylosus TaxID=1288 RepID=UPI001F542A3D